MDLIYWSTSAQMTQKSIPNGERVKRLNGQSAEGDVCPSAAYRKQAQAEMGAKAKR